MKKSFFYIILGIMLVPWSAQADVSFVAVRYGMDGTIKDISTGLTSDTMALTAPIVEPDGTLTDPEEELKRQMDALFMMDEEEILSEEQEETATTDLEDANLETKSEYEVPRKMVVMPIFETTSDSK